MAAPVVGPLRLPRASRRTDAALAVALAAVAVATRWPHRGRALFSWDSGLLASGIRSYDFAAGHPHPPFYPLAIAMGKALAPWTGEVGALVALAILASGVMAAFTYLAARLVLGVPASLLAAAFVVLSPTALFNGITPLTYALEGASSAVVGWAALRCRAAPTRGRAIGLAVATSVAIGIRPSSLFLVAPLAVWAVWGRERERLRALGWGLGAGAVTSVLWAVPALVAGGGLADFLAGNRYQSRYAVFAHTAFQDGWSVLPTNAARLASYVPWELPFLAAVAALALVGAFAWWPHRPRTMRAGLEGSASPLGWLAVWTLPSLWFFIVLYAGWPVYPSGYVLVLVPPVAIGAALVLASLARGVLASGAPATAQGLAAAAVVAALALPAAWPGAWDDATSGQREADAWAALLPSLREAYPPESTAIVTYYGWFWVQEGLPEYLAWGAQPYWVPGGDGEVLVQVAQAQHGHEWPPTYANAMDGPDDPLHPIPEWVETVVVVFAPPTRGELAILKPGIPVEQRTLPSGLRVDVVAAADLPATIEQALVWFDAEGRPIHVP